ncbi:MAG: chloramphenicol resistance protein [Clostridia bacterium]|nr:chloramphenicol resistance protein [Clostridia bacterium]
MGDKSLTEQMREFLFACPFLKDGVIHVDYLGICPTEYSIDAVPAKKNVKAYIDGSALCQFVFTFGSVEEYGADVDTNLANSGFYENFAAWLKEKSKKKELPSLENGRQALRIEAESEGYVIDARENMARYQIQCRLTYFEKGEEENDK